VDHDAFEFILREDGVHRLVGRIPAQVAERLFGLDAADVLAAVAAPLEKRLAGLGLSREGAAS
jgi:hypothetical protein